MSIVIESMSKKKRGIRVSRCLDFDGLRKAIKEKYGKDYEVIGIRQTKNGKGQLLIGRVRGKKGEIRFETGEKKKVRVKL